VPLGSSSVELAGGRVILWCQAVVHDLSRRRLEEGEKKDEDKGQGQERVLTGHIVYHPSNIFDIGRESDLYMVHLIFLPRMILDDYASTYFPSSNVDVLM